MDAQQITHAAAQSIAGRSGDGLAAVLRLDLGNAVLAQQLASGGGIEAMCAQALEEPYDEMLLEHFYFVRAMHAGDCVTAYGHQERVVSCFQARFARDDAWALPAMHVINLDLRLAALQADRQLVAKGSKGEKLEAAARVLNKSFQITVTDRAELSVSKKWGALHVINNLFKIYFELNNLRLCQNLIRAVEGPGFPRAIDGETVAGRRFPVAQLVTYKYFVGRLSMLNSQVVKAAAELQFAFDRCPRGAAKNKRLILRYLVPVRMVLGSFASEALLQKYRLPFFVALCRAVHRGDLAAFERELTAHQQLFIRHGSYLLVERAKIITYRNFFRRIHELDPQANKMDIGKFRRCLQATGTEMDADEIECVLANLIYSGYLKGYISHQHGKLVVSKGVAFPPLSEVSAGS